jgi:hypothetical protein
VHGEALETHGKAFVVRISPVRTASAHDEGRMATNGTAKGLCRAPLIARMTNPFVVRQRWYTAKKGSLSCVFVTHGKQIFGN